MTPVEGNRANTKRKQNNWRSGEVHIIYEKKKPVPRNNCWCNLKAGASEDNTMIIKVIPNTQKLTSREIMLIAGKVFCKNTRYRIIGWFKQMWITACLELNKFNLKTAKYICIFIESIHSTSLVLISDEFKVIVRLILSKCRTNISWT